MPAQAVLYFLPYRLPTQDEIGVARNSLIEFVVECDFSVTFQLIIRELGWVPSLR